MPGTGRLEFVSYQPWSSRAALRSSSYACLSETIRQLGLDIRLAPCALRLGHSSYPKANAPGSCEPTGRLSEGPPVRFPLDHSSGPPDLFLKLRQLEGFLKE